MPASQRFSSVFGAESSLKAKVEKKPLWKLVADMTPEEIVRVIDFRYITDVLTPEEALTMLKEQAKTKEERIQLALNDQVLWFAI